MRRVSGKDIAETGKWVYGRIVAVPPSFMMLISRR